MPVVFKVSMHPFIQFKVIGYKTPELCEEKGLDKTGLVGPEGRREYHIGLVYSHIPNRQGVIYERVEVIGAHMSNEYKEIFQESDYTDEIVFNEHMLRNCSICNPPSKSPMIDERKAPGA